MGIWQDIMDFFFPPRDSCPFCHENRAEKIICSECRRKIDFLMGDKACLAVYGGLMQEVIHRLKYQGESDLAKPLALLMVEKWGELDGLFVPIPLHEDKIRERGYNQSMVLASALAEVSYAKVYPALERIKYTKSQTKLNRYERMDNVKGAFKTVLDVKGKKLTIIDDVLTTGATTEEAADELLRAGAKEVKVLTIATGRKK